MMGFTQFVKIAVQGIKQIVYVDGKSTVEQMVPLPRDSEVAVTIARALGLSYEIVCPSDGQFGRRQTNGSWTGMLGMVQRREADMVISTLSITKERNEAFLFSYPFLMLDITFVTRKPQRSPNPAAVLQPFSAELWFALITCICVMSFLLRLLLKRRRYPLSTLLMSTARSLLNQDTGLFPERPHEYPLIASWLLGSTCMSYCYCAVLLSYLTFPRMRGIRTIKDLAGGITRGEYWATTYPGSFYSPYMLSSDERSMRIIGGSLAENVESSDFVEVLESFKVGDKIPVFMISKLFGEVYKDFYFFSDDIFFTILPAFATRKDFCCMSDVDKVIGRFWGSGIIRKIFSHHLYKGFLKDVRRMTTGSERGNSEGRLNMAVLKGPFVFLMASHALSLCVLLAELCVAKFQRDRLQ